MKVLFNIVLGLFLVKLFTFIRFPQKYVEINAYLAIKIDPFCKNIIYFNNDVPLHFTLFSDSSGLGALGHILMWIYTIPWYAYLLALFILLMVYIYKHYFH